MGAFIGVFMVAISGRSSYSGMYANKDFKFQISVARWFCVDWHEDLAFNCAGRRFDGWRLTMGAARKKTYMANEVKLTVRPRARARPRVRYSYHIDHLRDKRSWQTKPI